MMGAATGSSLWDLARSHYAGGRMREADALCARLLAAESDHAMTLHMRGTIARRLGRAPEALAHFTRALALAPAVVAIHEGLAETYRALARPVDAERHYRRAAELRPGAVPLLNLGNALLELRLPAQAADSYRSALRFDARLPEAWYGLGAALAASANPHAVDAFGRAVALRPDLVAAHEGLIAACLANDAGEAALRAACQALPHLDTPGLRVQFVDSLLAAPLADEIPGLRQLVLRALAERWTRPRDLARAACDLIALRPPVDRQDELLRLLLELAPICHPGLERALTEQRPMLLRAMVQDLGLAPEALAAACGLARQGFVNEYAWECGSEESGAVGALRDAMQADLDRGAVASDAMVAVIAMYVPLMSLRGADRLLSQPRTPPIAALLMQQIGEPAEEARLAGTIRRATAIEDDVSRRVRDQYEANPYPRWVATFGAGRAVRLGEWITARFAAAQAAGLPGGETLDVLIAGCGTGQHAVETVLSLAGARVLAIDLSLSSLAFAARMTAALGVAGIEYVQADLLADLQALAPPGRRFDMIGVGGVLHHLADPWAGWRNLLGLLRPGGVMNVLLYTVRGRDDVRRARAWIAARGFPPTPEGIRACRRDMMGLDEDWARRLSASPDFFSLSGCRDLLFHVQEQAVTLPQVAGFLAAEGIALLGIEVSPATERAFEAWARTRGEPVRPDLDGWERFEAKHPRCFAGMLNLWVRR